MQTSNNSLSDPRESTQDGNKNQHVSDDTSNNHSAMLDNVCSNDVDDLENQPTAKELACTSPQMYEEVVMKMLTQHQIRHSPNGSLQHAAKRR